MGMGSMEVALLGGVVCAWTLLPLLALLVMIWMLVRLQDRLRSLEVEMHRLQSELSSRVSSQEEEAPET